MRALEQGNSALIEQVERIEVDRPLDWVVHTSGANVVRASQRAWIHKPSMGFNEVLAEAIGLLVGRCLGVRVPAGAVYIENGAPSWLSEIVEHAKHWNPDLCGSLADPSEIARIYVLDAIIQNEDRHAGNLLLERRPGGLYQAWSIDTADAGINEPESLIESLEPPDPRNHFSAAPLDEQTCEEARETAKRCAVLLSSEGAQACASVACAISACPDWEPAVAEALRYRGQHAPAIVDRYLELLRDQ